jgi:glycosyltransferase involved in cell wall biosynthesis
LKLSIIIPVYNEEKTITPLVNKLLMVRFACETEVIIVNDGSTDDTADQLVKLLARHSSLNIVTLEKNSGKGAAIRIGLREVTGDYFVVQDADLELDPEDINKLIEVATEKNAQIVYGSRFRNPNESADYPTVTKIANCLLTKYTNLLFGCSLTDMATCYKLIRTDIIKNIKLSCTGFEFEPEVTAKLLTSGYRIIEVAVHYYPRSRQEGKKIIWLDGFNYLYVLTKIRVKQLRHKQSTEKPL